VGDFRIGLQARPQIVGRDLQPLSHHKFRSLHRSNVATSPASPHPLSIRLAAAIALALAFAAARAHAAVLTTTLAPDCTASGGDFACHLTGFLHLLYFIAAILAVVLLIVIALAVRMYRRNKTEDEKRRP
jgi:hypothetical protein